MNIYDFFNSRDIAAHCQKIGHKFTATEMAYIVWHSNHHTLADKHTAWQEIIDTMPDEPRKQKWIDEKEYTLHSFLQTYMHLQNAFLDEFCTTVENCIYSYETQERNSDRYCLNHIYFDNYEACLHAVQVNELETDNKIEKVKILRQRVYSDPVSFCEAKEREWVVFDQQLCPLDLCAAWDTEGEMRLLSPSYGFYDMWVAIPTPFQKGDAVIDVDVYFGYPQKHMPMVLDSIPYWKKDACNGDDCEDRIEHLMEMGGDWSDMQVEVYLQNGSGERYWDHGFDYLNLEYYREELREN